MLVMWVFFVVILLYGHVMALFNTQAAQYYDSLNYVKSLERPHLFLCIFLKIGQKGKHRIQRNCL